MPYTAQLVKSLRSADFDLETALSLSDEIHKAEEDGYILSAWEDKLWLELTDKIEEKRKLNGV